MISLETIHEIEKESGREMDICRFRPNLLVEMNSGKPFEEDADIMKSIVRLNDNNAGVYGAVIKTGDLYAGQKVYISD